MSDRITVERRFVSRDGSGMCAVVCIDGDPQIEFRRSGPRYGAEGVGPIELSAWSRNARDPTTVTVLLETWDTARKLYDQLGHEHLYRAEFRTKTGEPRDLYAWAMSPTAAHEQLRAVIDRWDVDEITYARMLFAEWIKVEPAR